MYTVQLFFARGKNGLRRLQGIFVVNGLVLSHAYKA